MGTADVVPGVSGGTVALVFGIYTELIDAVREGATALGRLLRGDVAGAVRALRQIDWLFLLPLLAGIGLAVVTLAHTIEVLLEDHPVQMAAVFFGLVVGSVVVTAPLVQWGRRPIAALLVVGVATFALLGLRSAPADDPALWFVVVAGSIAICAMILPGISGSFLLLMMGMYDFVLGAVSDRDLLIIAAFGIGAVTGLAAFSTVLHWALNAHTDLVLAGLIGLMTGSLRVLWPWPDGTNTTTLALPADPTVGPVLLGVAACAIVVVVGHLANRRQQRADVIEAPEARIR